jgi:hypothetical protein
MVFSTFGDIIGAARRVDRLFNNVDKAQKGIEALAERLPAVEDRSLAMEAGQELQVEKSQSAASGVVHMHLVNMAGRLGAVEEALRRT